MNILSKIDQVYVLNLPFRNDRRKKWSIQKQYLTILNPKFQFFNAISGNDISNHTVLNNGELGCSLSHMSIWIEAQNLGYKYILVFEDDVIIDREFEFNLSNILNEIQYNFDWLYLYNTWDYRPVSNYSKNIYKVVASLGTQAYVLNLDSVNRIKPFVGEFIYPIDVVMGHISFLSRVYRPVHQFVIHDDKSESSISVDKQKKISFFKKVIKKFNFI